LPEQAGIYSHGATVIPSLFGQGTPTNDLRGALEELSATHRTIATRIADATPSSANSGFADQLKGSMKNNEADLTRNMASLADNEMRYETTAKLLQKSYADLRTAITDHG
jgi:flagellar basal body rod protein FlgB